MVQIKNKFMSLLGDYLLCKYPITLNVLTLPKRLRAYNYKITVVIQYIPKMAIYTRGGWGAQRTNLGLSSPNSHA